MKPIKEAILGKRVQRRLLAAADEALVRLGQDAERRQQRRATRRAVARAATITALAGAGAAAVLVARQVLKTKAQKPRRRT